MKRNNVRVQLRRELKEILIEEDVIREELDSCKSRDIREGVIQFIAISKEEVKDIKHPVVIVFKSPITKEEYKQECKDGYLAYNLCNSLDQYGSTYKIIL